jgi:hypothetical protein
LVRAILTLTVALWTLASSSAQGEDGRTASTMRERAMESCQGKEGSAWGTCMAIHLCAQTEAPARCYEQRSKAYSEAIAKTIARARLSRECIDNLSGGERRACLQQACSDAKDPGVCVTQAERRQRNAEARQKARDACKDVPRAELPQCVREHFRRAPDG